MNSSIAALNIRAIILLQRSEYHEAAHFLDQAITKCEARMDEVEMEAHFDDFEEDGDVLFNDGEETQANFELRPARVILPEAARVEEERSGFSLYSRVLMFVPADRTLRGPEDYIMSDEALITSRVNCYITTSTLLYNKGLCMQLYSLSSMNKDYLCSQATEALGLSRAIHANLTSYFLAEHNLLEMAILNNLGFACYQLFDQRDARFCLERMETLLEEFSEDDIPDEFLLFASNIRRKTFLQWRLAPAA